MLLRRPTTMTGTPDSPTTGLIVVRMNECISKETAKILRNNGFDMATLSRNVYLVPEEAGHMLLTANAAVVPVLWARENLARQLTPALRPDCECGGHLNAGADDEDNGRAPTCSACPTPRPTGTFSFRKTCTEMYEGSLSDHPDGFTLIIRDEPKRRATQKKRSERGGHWELNSLFAAAAVRLRSITAHEWKATDSSGRYPSEAYGWAYGATKSGKFGLVAVHPDRQADNVQHSVDPFALLGSVDSPVGIECLYGRKDGNFGGLDY